MVCIKNYHHKNADYKTDNKIRDKQSSREGINPVLVIMNCILPKHLTGYTYIKNPQMNTPENQGYVNT